MHDVNEWIEAINELNSDLTRNAGYMTSVRLLMVTETDEDVKNGANRSGAYKSRNGSKRKDWQARFTTIVGSKKYRDERKRVSGIDRAYKARAALVKSHERDPDVIAARMQNIVLPKMRNGLPRANYSKIRKHPNCVNHNLKK